MPAAIACVMIDIVKSRTIQNCLKARVGDKTDRTYTEAIYNPCRQRFLDFLQRHNGKLHDDVGDQLAAYFDYAQDAVHFVVALQRTMQGSPIPVPEGAACPYLQLRAAVGFGTIEDAAYDRPGEYRVSSYSDLARVLAVAWPEQILVTEDALKRAGTLGDGISIHSWQNIVLPKESQKITLVEVLWDGRTGRKPNSLSDAPEPALNPDAAQSQQPIPGAGAADSTPASPATAPAGVTRRDVIVALLTSSVTLAVAEVYKTVKGLVQQVPTSPDRALLSSLVRPDGPIQLFAGNTNKLAQMEGKQGLSPNLTNTARNLSSFLVQAGARVEVVREDDPVLALNPEANNLLLLGGPVANPLMARLGGYAYPDRAKPPSFDRTGGRFGFRWFFDCGDPNLGWGFHNGAHQKAWRYDRKHDLTIELVERDVYGLYDRLAGRSRLFSKDPRGFLTEEATLITRIRNPANPSLFITMLAGGHGYSTLALSADLAANLDALKSKTSGLEQFQVLVPARLRHERDLGTMARPQWADAEVHRLG